MQKFSVDSRRAWGCGYLPADPRVPVRAWDHAGRQPGRDERDEHGRIHLPICPGYLCGLPEVVETSHARLYWDKGELGQFCAGQVTPELRDAITVLECEAARVNEWAAKNPKKGEG